MHSLFLVYYMFNKILLDYMKAYHQILQEQDMEQTLMLLTLDIPLTYQV